MSDKIKRSPIKYPRKSGNPSWVKGSSGNPHGRPKNTEMAELRRALKWAAKKQKKTLLRHFVERAYQDDRVLVALMKKLLPDMAASTIEPVGDMPKTFAEWVKLIKKSR